jgi:spore germination protein GerM
VHGGPNIEAENPIQPLAAVVANGSIDSLPTALKLLFCGPCLAEGLLNEMSDDTDLCDVNCLF